MPTIRIDIEAEARAAAQTLANVSKSLGELRKSTEQTGRAMAKAVTTGTVKDFQSFLQVTSKGTDATNAFAKSVDAMAHQMGMSASQARNMVQQMNQMQGGMQRTVSVTQSLGSELHGLAARYISAAAAAALIRKGVTEWGNFDHQLRGVQVQTGATREEVDDLGNSMRSLAAKLGTPAAQLLAGFEALRERAGLSIKEAREVYPAIALAAKGANANVVQFAESIGSSMLKGLKKEEVGKVLDIFAKSTQDLKLNADKLSQGWPRLTTHMERWGMTGAKGTAQMLVGIHQVNENLGNTADSTTALDRILSNFDNEKLAKALGLESGKDLLEWYDEAKARGDDILEFHGKVLRAAVARGAKLDQIFSPREYLAQKAFLDTLETRSRKVADAMNAEGSAAKAGQTMIEGSKASVDKLNESYTRLVETIGKAADAAGSSKLMNMISKGLEAAVLKEEFYQNIKAGMTQELAAAKYRAELAKLEKEEDRTDLHKKDIETYEIMRKQPSERVKNPPQWFGLPAAPEDVPRPGQKPRGVIEGLLGQDPESGTNPLRRGPTPPRPRPPLRFRSLESGETPRSLGETDDTLKKSLEEQKKATGLLGQIHQDPVAQIEVTPDSQPPPPRQHGGPVYRGRRYRVGEAGPETFVPGETGQIVPHEGREGMADDQTLEEISSTERQSLSEERQMKVLLQSIDNYLREATDEGGEGGGAARLGGGRAGPFGGGAGTMGAGSMATGRSGGPIGGPSGPSAPSETAPAETTSAAPTAPSGDLTGGTWTRPPGQAPSGEDPDAVPQDTIPPAAPTAPTAPRGGVGVQGAQGAEALQKAVGISSKEYDAFRQGMADIESSGGKYGLKGGSSGRFSGAYQFGAEEIRTTAQRLGEKPPTREQFLADPKMQERYMSAYTQQHHEQLMKHPKYAAMSPREKLKILGYAHNQGVGSRQRGTGAMGYLDTGRAGRDAFGTSGTKYGQQIEKRLGELDRGGTPGSGLARGDEKPPGAPPSSGEDPSTLNPPPTASAPAAPGASRAGGTVAERQKAMGATREYAVQQDVKTQLAAAAEASGTQAEVFSGGQLRPFRTKSGKMTSTRHNIDVHGKGGAADVKFIDIDPKTGKPVLGPDGKPRVLDMTVPADRARIKKGMVAAFRAGATGIGAGTDYMGPRSVHIGKGAATSWGGEEKMIEEARREAKRLGPLSAKEKAEILARAEGAQKTQTATTTPAPPTVTTAPAPPPGQLSEGQEQAYGRFGVRPQAQKEGEFPGQKPIVRPPGAGGGDEDVAPAPQQAGAGGGRSEAATRTAEATEPPPEGRQHGGSVLPGQEYMVGERGPERFIPGTAGQVMPTGQGMSASVNFDGAYDQILRMRRIMEQPMSVNFQGDQFVRPDWRHEAGNAYGRTRRHSMSDIGVA